MRESRCFSTAGSRGGDRCATQGLGYCRNRIVGRRSQKTVNVHGVVTEKLHATECLAQWTGQQLVQELVAKASMLEAFLGFVNFFPNLKQRKNKVTPEYLSKGRTHSSRRTGLLEIFNEAGLAIDNMNSICDAVSSSLHSC